MKVWVYLPLLVSLVFPLATRRMATWLPPSIAARVAAGGAAVAGIAYVCCLTLLSLTLFDDLPPLSAFEDRHLPKPVPGWLAAVAALALLVGAVRLVRSAVRRHRVLRELRSLGRPNAGLVVADLAEPFAVAVPGRPGHVLVTSGMLRLFDGGERRVLLAHEQSHLIRGHHRLGAIAAYAAAMNPLLNRTAALVVYLVERWADEDAATETGDRDLVARTVAKASLASARQGFAPAMGLHGSTAVGRVTAMASPRRPNRWGALAGVMTLTTVQVLATVLASVEFVAVAGAWLGMLAD